MKQRVYINSGEYSASDVIEQIDFDDQDGKNRLGAVDVNYNNLVVVTTAELLFYWEGREVFKMWLKDVCNRSVKSLLFDDIQANFPQGHTADNLSISFKGKKLIDG